MNLDATHAAFLALMTRFEAGLSRKVAADKNRYIRACADRFAEHGTPNFFDLTDRHQQEIQSTLSAAYRKIVPAFGMHAIEQVRAAQKDDQLSGLWIDLADQWIHTEGLQRSHLIADTTESDVLAALSEGMDQGLGTAAIARSIRQVTGLTPWRSELIARTETHAAANYGSIETVRNAETTLDIQMLKEWAPTIDGRTRPAHAAMAGSPAIPLDQPFNVDGESMDRPGDPAGSAANVLQCRCTLLYSEAG